MGEIFFLLVLRLGDPFPHSPADSLGGGRRGGDVVRNHRLQGLAHRLLQCQQKVSYGLQGVPKLDISSPIFTHAL